MQLHDIHAAYSTAQTLFGVEPDPIEFEDIAMVAWELINSKHTRLYRYKASTINKTLELPCNVSFIESVHIPLEDAQLTSPKTNFNSYENQWIEQYIELWKRNQDPLYHKGKLIDYREGNNTIYFSNNHKNVIVIYHGVIMDDDGLPLVNDKELYAIATYVAYAMTYRTALMSRDSRQIQIAQTLKADWLRACNAARISEHLSQNDMDKILDAKTRWDRKTFGHSYKPVL